MWYSYVIVLEKMVQLIGQENHEYAIRTIFEMFQHPRLNKQVCLHPPVKTDKALWV